MATTRHAMLPLSQLSPGWTVSLSGTFVEGVDYSIHRRFPFPLLSRSGLLLLGAVLGTALLATGNAGGVESATYDVVTNARKILDTTTAYEHHRVLLQVVADARDVGGDLDLVGQTNTSNLTESRV